MTALQLRDFTFFIAKASVGDINSLSASVALI